MTDLGINTGDSNTVGWVPESDPDKAYTFGTGTAQEIGTLIEQIEQAAIADGGLIRVDSAGYHMLKRLKTLMQEYTMTSSVGSANPGQINVNGRTVVAESQRIIGNYVGTLEDGGTVSVAQMADLFGVQWSLDVGLFANGSQITNTDLVLRDTTTPPPGNAAPPIDTILPVEIPERTPVGDSLVDRAQALLRDALSADTVEAKSVLYEQAMDLLDQNVMNALPEPTPLPDPVPLPEPIIVPDAGIPQDTWDNLQSLEYIASHPDLMDAYGTDVGQAEVHYNSSGNDEGRRITFSAADYLAANPDLQEAFGGDLGAAARHYIETGRNEDRVLAPPAPEPTPAPTPEPAPDPVMEPVTSVFGGDTLMGVLSTDDDRGLVHAVDENGLGRGVGYTEDGQINSSKPVTFDAGEMFDSGHVAITNLFNNEDGVQETATVRAYKDGEMVWESEVRGDTDGVQTLDIDVAFDQLTFTSDNASGNSDFSVLEVQGTRNEVQEVAPDDGAGETPDTEMPEDTPDTGEGDNQLVLSDEMTRFLAELDILEDLMQQSGQTGFYNDIVELTSLALETTRSTSEGGAATSFGEYEQLRAGLDDLYTDVLASADGFENPSAAIDALMRALIQLTNLIAGDS